MFTLKPIGNAFYEVRNNSNATEADWTAARRDTCLVFLIAFGIFFALQLFNEIGKGRYGNACVLIILAGSFVWLMFPAVKRAYNIYRYGEKVRARVKNVKGKWFIFGFLGWKVEVEFEDKEQNPTIAEFLLSDKYDPLKKDDQLTVYYNKSYSTQCLPNKAELKLKNKKNK